MDMACLGDARLDLGCHILSILLSNTTTRIFVHRMSSARSLDVAAYFPFLTHPSTASRPSPIFSSTVATAARECTLVISQALWMLFFVLKWRGWLVGITYLKQVDLPLGIVMISSSKPALNSFSSSSRLPAFSIRLLSVVGSPHSPPVVCKVSRQRSTLGLSTARTIFRDVFPCRCMRRPTPILVRRRKECGANMSARVRRSEAS